MAAGSGNHVSSIQLSDRKLSYKKEETACDCSETMHLELKNVKLGLSSLREILRVLQAEISQSSKPSKNNRNEVCEGEESYTLSARQEWTTLPSNRRRKLPPTNTNFRQLPLVTSNKFAALANLKSETHSRLCAPYELLQATPITVFECK